MCWFFGGNPGKPLSDDNMPIEEHMKLYENQGFERKEAMKKVAKDRGITKREVYDYLLTIENC